MIVLDGTNLTAEQVDAIARRRTGFSLDSAARDRAAASAVFADQAAQVRSLYGRSTGVGANREIPLADADGLALLRSHATAAGPLRSAERVRAMLTVRLNQLAAGGSGVAPAVLDGLSAMLSTNALPPVRELGGIGTGDLPALAVTGLVLAGTVDTMPPPLPTAIGIGDALPLMSSNAAALGDAALALVELRTLARAALVVAALTFSAARGNIEAFSPAAERATPFPGARTVCQTVRDLTGSLGKPTRIQDPFALRCLPQIHGALFDSLAAMDTTVTAMVNAPSENPVLLPQVGVAHHGAFHAAYLTQALDAALLALAQAAQLSLARVTMLSEPTITGLAPFLGDGRPGASGVMVIEYVAASALGELRALAQPVGLQPVTLSRGVEEDASFASLAAAQALRAIPHYRTLLACELVVAWRCELMGGATLPGNLAAVLRGCPGMDTDLTDRDLTLDISAAEDLLAELGSAEKH